MTAASPVERESENLGTTGPINLEGGKAKQLFELLRNEITLQRLKPGDQLPASRQLAKEFGISRNCVSVAFEMLAAEGLVSGRVGSGTFVAAAPLASNVIGFNNDQLTDSLSDWAKALPAQPYILPTRPLRIDFRPGLPNRIGMDTCCTPMRRAINRLSGTDIRDSDVNDPAGRLRLRTFIANHLRITRGLVCRPSDIVLTSGTHQSLDLIARLFARTGAKLAVEDPCYPLVPKLFRAHGFQLSPMAVDEEGVNVEQFGVDARLAYTTPNNQFPMGVRLSPPRRAELLQRASQHNAFIIEDDYDGELYSLAKQGTCLKADDYFDRVIYLGSFSKYLFPQLRLAYIVAPKCIRDLLVHAKWLTDRQVSLPIQLCLESLLQNGEFLKIVRRSERDYVARLGALRTFADTYLSSCFSLPPNAHGFHIVASATSNYDVEGLVQRAFAAGVGVYSLSSFALETQQAGLVFGLAALSEIEIEEGIRVIGTLL